MSSRNAAAIVASLSLVAFAHVGHAQAATPAKPATPAVPAHASVKTASDTSTKKWHHTASTRKHHVRKHAAKKVTPSDSTHAMSPAAPAPKKP